MASLTGTVPLFVEIAPGGDPAGDGSTWTWTDITADVRNSRGVVIDEGRQDEANLVDARTISMDLNNAASRVASTLGRTGCYSPRNPMGPYAGKLTKNTPIRVGVRSADDEFGRTSASGWGTADWGGAWTTMGTQSDATVSGGVGLRALPTANTAMLHYLTAGGGTDVDITMKVATPVATTGGNLVCGPAARVSASLTDFYAGWMEFAPSGVLQAKIQRFSSTAGNAALAQLSPIPSLTYTPGTYVNVRFQVDGSVLRLKVWLDGTNEPTAWTLTASDSNITSGGYAGIYMWRLSTNTNTGSQYAIDSFHVKAVEAVANLTELPPRWDQTTNNAWVPIQAAGALRRLSQGAPALNSPLYNQMVRQPGISGLWMGEDGSGSTQLTAADGWSLPAQLEGGYTMAGDNTLPGAKTTFKLTDGFSRARGKFSRNTAAASGFSFMLFFKFDSEPVAEHEICKLVVQMGSVASIRIKVTASGVLNVYGYGGTDDVLIFSQGASTGLKWAEWTAIQLETERISSTINWTMIVHKVGASTGFGAFGNSVSGTRNPTMSSWQLTGNGFSQVAFSTIYGGTNALPFVDSTFALVSNGYQGETAGARMARVFADAGIPFTLEPGITSEMGYQPEGDALTIARDCEQADAGILYERGVGLAYRPRRSRYNPAVAMALDVSQGHLDEPPEPTDDDRFEANDVTVTRTDGGSARVSDEVRAALVGRYIKPSTINVFQDSDLLGQAGLRLSLGTVNDLRWPRIKINLRRNFDLVPSWLSRRFAFRMTAVNEPSQIKGWGPDVVVEGYTLIMKAEEWTVECYTSPVKPWLAGVYGTTRYDARGSLTVDNKAVGSGGVYSTTNGTIYVNTPGKQWGTQTPYNIEVGDEVMTVNSVFTSGSDQGLNVTRSVNGVVKTHLAGEEVHIADQRRWAL